MATPIIEDINFDMHDNKAFVPTDTLDPDDKSDDVHLKASNETTAESSFQAGDHKKKSTATNKTQDELRTIITVCVFFGVSVAIALILTIYLGPPQIIPHGAVSSETLKCSEIGSQVLMSGGSAVDSAIAVALCESSINFDTGRISGCGILIMHDQRRNSSNTIDFSCSSTGRIGKYSVEIPTFLRGLAVAHEKYGLLKWKDVLQPVLKLIDSEFTSSPQKQELYNDIANKGVDFFYLPPVASEITEAVNNHTGEEEMKLEDLKSYTPSLKAPIKSFFKGYSVESVCGTSSSLMLLLLAVLENLTASERVPWNATDFYYYFVKAAKAVQISQENMTAWRSSDEERRSYAETLASQIYNDEESDYYDLRTINGSSDGLSASMVSIVGPSDDLVSLAVWHNKNSKLTTQPHKIVLNEHIGSFHNPDDDGEEKLGYKEKFLSVIVHNLVKPCSLRFAITGSNYLDIVHVLINHFGHGMNLTDAVSAPRLYIRGDTVLYQDEFPQEAVDVLERKGHYKLVKISSGNSTSEYPSVVRIVWKNKETVEACADKEENNFYIF